MRPPSSGPKRMGRGRGNIFSVSNENDQADLLIYPVVNNRLTEQCTEEERIRELKRPFPGSQRIVTRGALSAAYP